MDVCRVDEDDREDQRVRDRARPDEGDEATNQEEFDFVEQLSEDFFCPVTFELLLNPHQTTCCGHHLSEKAVKRLQREGKPCPMCKELKLVTMPDKFFKRKASAVLIRCPYKESECEWVGEVGGAKQHIRACPKRPWKCQHCDFTSTFDIGIQHVVQCTKHPVPCPNECEIGTVPRCDVEKHCTECPLEPVACEFADGGCSVKVTRRDLKQHMEESLQQHLFSATLLNLKLTRETIAEKDRLLALKEQQLAEKDCQIADKDNQLAEKDRQVADKDHQLAEKDKIIAMKDDQMFEALLQLQRGVLEFTGGMMTIHGFTCHRFTLEKFSECQESDDIYGDWFSEPFCSHPGDYELQLNVETKQCSSHMTIRLSSEESAVGKTFIFGLQLLNHRNNYHSHFFRIFEASVKENTYTNPYDYIRFKELYKSNKTVQYLKYDCLKFVLWIKTKR